MCNTNHTCQSLTVPLLCCETLCVCAEADNKSAMVVQMDQWSVLNGCGRVEVEI